MDNIIDVTGGNGGKAYLLLGGKKTALLDCGMAYCAPNLIKAIKQVRSCITINYILISHSHYDHIGAIPYLKAEWPACQVVGSAYDKRVLNSPSALKTIKELSMQAARIFDSGDLKEYDDNLLKVDKVIHDGDILDLGGMAVKVLETPGHTKSSLSFLVNNEILFPSESTGYMSKSGRVYPSFITSYSDAIDSIQKCQKLNPQYIVSPHYGLVSKRDTRNYWEKCLLAAAETKEFILRLGEHGLDEEEIFIRYEKRYRDEQSRQEQPFNAFKANTLPMIRSLLRTW